MSSIVIHSDNKADLDILIKIAKRLNAKVEKLENKNETPCEMDIDWNIDKLFKT